MDATNKAIYTLLQSVMDTSVDIFWGNSNFFDEKEKGEFTTAEYNEAQEWAILEMLERIRYGNDFPYKYPSEEDSSIPFDIMISELGELYGKFLRLINNRKSLC